MTRRPFSRAPDSRRAALIAATQDIIAERGLQGTNVRDIAARAGVTGGLIRHYFAGKDDLIQATYRQTMSDLTGLTRAAIASYDAPPKARLARFIRASVTVPVVDPRVLSLWASFISTIQTDPDMAAIHREAYLDFRSIVETLVAEVFAAEDRSITLPQRESYAIAINGILDGLWIEGCLAGELFDGDQLEQAARQSIEAILGLKLND